ncbi:MAG: phosphopantothenoylcysteine decarboxylase [Candidatus Omnitrophica bacterium]|nr:phosphopantothenoylcysteine decarboxylase [Candidatus Omnitrophota bacterium]
MTERRLAVGCLRGCSVLVTGGPTAVAIDDMRVITNRSTGEMGRLLANACAAAGARVTLLEGAVTTAVPLTAVKVHKFFLFDELARLLKEELSRGYDVVIHAAAVSDFAPARTFRGKLDSARTLKLELKPTPKLLNVIKRQAPQALLVAFKLTSTMKGLLLRARRICLEAQADLVVANSLGYGSYAAFVLRQDGGVTPTVNSRRKLVKVLISEIDRSFQDKRPV